MRLLLVRYYYDYSPPEQPDTPLPKFTEDKPSPTCTACSAKTGVCNRQGSQRVLQGTTDPLLMGAAFKGLVLGNSHLTII